MKKLLFAVILFTLISGCKEDRFEKGAIIKMTGAYSSFLPCNGCKGLSYELSLNEDLKFNERLIYINENIQPIFNNGTWQFEDDNTKIRLFKKDTKAMSLFLITKEGLIMLDSNGKKFTGEDADKYLLKPGSIQIPEFMLVDTTLTKDPNSLTGIWALTEMNGQKPDESKYQNGLPYLNITESDNKFTTMSGCNTSKGAVQIKDDLISFSKFMSSNMPCEGTAESEYLSAMKSADSFTLENGILSLKAAGKTVLKFTK
ncbi:MAG: copper resistance protein NlpE N-terminal domain-containing protein [Ignavibacteriae bacterium]|nr:copper resistance protein NlpE N-terminal domain-containing protein [Ignavibacteriota bacterium]